jgi:hypothetical protein
MGRRRKLVQKAMPALLVIAVLCDVLFVGLMFRSSTIGEVLRRESGETTATSTDARNVDIGVAAGKILFFYSHHRGFNHQDIQSQDIEVRSPRWSYHRFDPVGTSWWGDEPGWISGLGIGWQHTTNDTAFSSSVRMIGRRLWIRVDVRLLLFLSLVATALLLYRWRCARTAQRELAGLCAQCGYDLRESPQRCPECGAVPLAAVKAG